MFKKRNLTLRTSPKIIPHNQLLVLLQTDRWAPRDCRYQVCRIVMGCVTMPWPSLKLVVLVVLAAALILNTSTANGTPCSELHCVDTSTAECKFCHRRVGKRTESYAWRDDRESNNLIDRGRMTTECYLDAVVGSLPHELQEQVFEVLELVLSMNR